MANGTVGWAVSRGWMMDLSDISQGLSDDQFRAVRAILNWYAESPAREFYLAGYAGTGKTTIAARLIRHLERRRAHVVVGAYTGKAASVLRKKGLGQAGTLHSLIYTVEPGPPRRWVLSSLSPMAHADLVLIDEVSMVGEELAADVRSFGRKIFVLGDPGQLPPVRGTGAFTRRDPDMTLTEIHRQAAGSPILKLATIARHGGPIEPSSNPAATVEPVTMTKLLEAYKRGDQLICGTHRARWAVTRRIRQMVGINNEFPLVGERVLCCQNDRNIGIYNGELGTVVTILDDGSNDWDGRPSYEIKMDDLDGTIEVKVDPTPFREHQLGGRIKAEQPRRGTQVFDFGYVLTCHKAQGSEWPAVTIVDDSSAFREDRWKWLYTALTRASERVTLLTREEEYRRG